MRAYLGVLPVCERVTRVLIFVRRTDREYIRWCYMDSIGIEQGYTGVKTRRKETRQRWNNAQERGARSDVYSSKVKFQQIPLRWP
jgi:hypothetical protein